MACAEVICEGCGKRFSYVAIPEPDGGVAGARAACMAQMMPPTRCPHCRYLQLWMQAYWRQRWAIVLAVPGPALVAAIGLGIWWGRPLSAAAVIALLVAAVVTGPVPSLMFVFLAQPNGLWCRRYGAPAGDARVPNFFDEHPLLGALAGEVWLSRERLEKDFSDEDVWSIGNAAGMWLSDGQPVWSPERWERANKKHPDDVQAAKTMLSEVVQALDRAERDVSKFLPRSAVKDFLDRTRQLHTQCGQLRKVVPGPGGKMTRDQFWDIGSRLMRATTAWMDDQRERLLDLLARHYAPPTDE